MIDVVLPRFYYYRRDKSDRDWIESRMIEIPESKRQEVADEYERRYMTRNGGDRKTANTYIHHVALEYRQDRYGKQQKEV